MRWSFPPIETINPYLMGNQNFDLRESAVREQVKQLIFEDDEFLFRVLLNLDDTLYVPEIHIKWLRLADSSRQTMLLAPRDSLKCLHPSTLIPNKLGCNYLGDLREQETISSVFENENSIVNMKGSTSVNYIVKITADNPFNFWLYASKDHEFFCFDIVRSAFDTVKAEDLNVDKHFPLLAKPLDFNPFVDANELVLNLLVRSLHHLPNSQQFNSDIFQLNTSSFSKLLEKIIEDRVLWNRINVDDNDLMFVKNTLRVLMFYHGMIEVTKSNVIPFLKSKLLLKNKRSLNISEIAFLLDVESDFKPTPLQTTENAYFTRIKQIDHIYIDSGDMRFEDISTSTKHYIANGFVTHNSTVRTIGGILRAALKEPERRYAIISATGKLANSYVRKIKRICEFNPAIRYCFNDIISPNEVARWSGEALEFKRNSTFPEPTIWGLGVGTDFTGFHFDVAFFEDLVTIKHKHSPTLRESTWDWFKLAAMPALDKKRGEGHITGTRYHWNDLYGKIIEITEATGAWTILRQPACDEELLSQGVFKSFWPERFPEDDLMAVRSDYGEEAFQLQYQVAGGVTISDQDYIQKIREAILPLESLNSLIDHVIGVDLASKGMKQGQIASRERKKSKFSISAVARHSITGKFVVCEVISISRPTLNDQREHVYSQYEKYNCLIAGIELNAYQNVFREYLEEGTTPIGIKPIQSFNSKDARFEYIVNLIKSGNLFFIENQCQAVIDELFTYPENTADSIDSLFFALKVCLRDTNIRYL